MMAALDIQARLPMGNNNMRAIGKTNGRAACKTLIDSERRKNTQASSDVGARQLARF